MKWLTASLILLMIAVFAGCSKDETNPAPVTGVRGTWKYIGYSGGLAGLPLTQEDTVTYFMQFDNLRYTSVRNGVQGCGTYSFRKDSTGYNEKIGLLKLSGETGADNFEVYLHKDTLTLYPHQMADALSYHFIYSLKQLDWCDNGN